MKKAMELFLMVTLLILIVPAGLASGNPEKPLVVATIPPLAAIVQEAFGGSVDVVYIIPLGADPHDYQLTAEQVSLLQKADVIVTTGGHLPVEGKITQLKEEGVITAHVLLIDDYEKYGFRYLKEHWYNEKDNPHGTWLDPTNALAIAEATERALEDADPENAVVYRKDFELFKAKVEGIVLSYSALVKGNLTAVVQMPPCQYAIEWLGIRAVSAIKPEEEVPAKGVDEVLPDAEKADLIVYSMQSPDQLKDAVFELSEKSGKPIAGITVFWKDEPYTKVLSENSASIIQAITGEKSGKENTPATKGSLYSIPALFVGLSLGIALGYLIKR